MKAEAAARKKDKMKIGIGIGVTHIRPPVGARLSAGLVSYWKLDEASGGATDATGANALAEAGTVGSAAGRVGTARVYAAGDYHEAAGAGVLDFAPGSPFTLAVWAYPTDLTWFGMLLAKSGRFDLRRFGDSWQFSGGGGTAHLSAAAAVNTWHFLVATYDGAGGFSLSVNNGTPATAASDTGNNAAGVFQIGARDGANGFVGRIDEASVWSRVLSPAEVTAVYNGGSGTTYPLP